MSPETGGFQAFPTPTLPREFDLTSSCPVPLVGFRSVSKHPETAINTCSGRILDFANPSSDAITLDDIAGGLSLAPRFGGQALEFRSVAEHAIDVAEVTVAMGYPDLALLALHHDSHEAYACDIPRPLKLLLSDYGKITARLDRVITEALGLPVLDPASKDGRRVKQADDAMFIVEAERFCPEKFPSPTFRYRRSNLPERPSAATHRLPRMRPGKSSWPFTLLTPGSRDDETRRDEAMSDGTKSIPTVAVRTGTAHSTSGRRETGSGRLDIERNGGCSGNVFERRSRY